MWADTLTVAPRLGSPGNPIATLHSGDEVLIESVGGPPAEGNGRPGEVGPMVVAGAEPGDAVVILIEHLAVKGESAASRSGGSEHWQVWPMDAASGTLSLPGSDTRLSVRPTLGLVRLASPGEGHPGETGRGGGNLAMAHLAVGDTVSLPCLVPGGLLSLGKGRAVPWEGAGSGLLASLEVRFRVELKKGEAILWPRVENQQSIGVVAAAGKDSDASQAALDSLAAWLLHDRGLPPDPLRALLAVAASVSSGRTEGQGSWSFVRIARSNLPGGAPRGVHLGEIPWTEAEGVLGGDRVVLLPLGAGSKEHGPHLLLGNDEILARYLADRVVAARPVASLPVLTYGFYPAFLEYPGSVSLSSAVQRDLVAQICRSIARYGPRRFYVLNTGLSTSRPLRDTAALLAKEGILLRFSDLTRLAKGTEDRVRQEAYGTHADEIETSMLLYIAPSAVRMDRARADGAGERPGPLTRDPDRAGGHYSPSGVFGDPTLATWEKGRAMVEAIVTDLLAEIDALRAETPPPGTPLSPLE
jgi:creatinine amidohydrolase